MEAGEIEVYARWLVLHWVRCLALIGPMTLFDRSGGSRLVKLALGLGLGFLASISADVASFHDPGMSPLLLLLVCKELLIGVIFGFAADLIFSTIRTAGHFVGQEMGFNMANIQDPVSGVQVQLMAHLYESLGVVAFFAIGGHTFVIRGLLASFDRYPVDRLALDPELLHAVIIYTTGIFIAALQVAAPVFCALMLLGVALAILARVAPQLHVMQLAFPIRIMAGLVLVVVCMQGTVGSFGIVFDRCETFFFETLGGS